MTTRSKVSVDDKILSEYPNETALRKSAKQVEPGTSVESSEINKTAEKSSEINKTPEKFSEINKAAENSSQTNQSAEELSKIIEKNPSILEILTDDESEEENSQPPFKNNQPRKNPPNRKMAEPARLDATSLSLLRDAVRIIPEFDGKRENLPRYAMGMEDARALVGEALDLHLLRLSKTKLSSAVWNRISKITFASTSELVQYLKKTYDPPRDIYQLTGELGSSFQRRTDSVDDFADKIRVISDQIMDAYLNKHNDLPPAEKSRIEEMASRCFQRGLKDEIRRCIGDQANLSDAVNKAKEIERELNDLAQLRLGDAQKNKIVDNRAAIHVVESRDSGAGKGTEAASPAGKVVCQLCKKSGHAANSCWAAQNKGGKPGTVTCQLCGGAGHEADKCQAPSAAPVAVGVPVCQRCKVAGHSANQCPSSLQLPTDQLTVCQICGKRGHLAEKCYSVPCRGCGRKGHLAETCWKVLQSGATPASAPGQGPPQLKNNLAQPSMQCYACQGWGHVARNCPSRNAGQRTDQTGGGPSSYAQAAGPARQASCAYCKQPGHVISECAVRTARYGPMMAQGNGQGLPAQGAQVEAQSRSHPTMTLVSLVK